ESSGRMHECGGEAALRTGKPVTNGSAAARESRGFAESQQKSCNEEATDAGGDGPAKGSHTPEKGADAADEPHAKAIQQKPGGQLARGIGPAISARQVAEQDRRDSERGPQRILRHGQVNGVEIIDQDAEAKQPGDAQPSPPYG